jgi:DNA primase
MVDWYSVLTKYGVDIPYEDQVMISCPFHDDRRVSCSINIDKGLWICFAGCGQGSLKGFIFKLSGKPWEELSYELDDNLDINAIELDSIFSDAEIDYMGEETSYEEPENLLPVPNNHWIYDRGFSKDLISGWDCKVNQYQDFMIPVKDLENETLGWISRRLQATPKYLFSKGFKKSQTLFGINHVKEEQELYVVEGALDCMWLQQHGYASVAVLGANLSKKQIDLLGQINPSRIVLSLDNDVAGSKGMQKATLDINERFLISYLRLPKNYKDVQEIRDTQTLHTVLQNKTII